MISFPEELLQIIHKFLWHFCNWLVKFSGVMSELALQIWNDSCKYFINDTIEFVVHMPPYLLPIEPKHIICCITANILSAKQGTQYVCTNFWTFVCTNCSGIQWVWIFKKKNFKHKFSSNFPDSAACFSSWVFEFGFTQFSLKIHLRERGVNNLLSLP